MLQTLGLVMHFIPRELEHFVKKPLQQAMMTQDFQSAALPYPGQAHAMAFFILYERWPLPGKFLEHSRDGGRADIEVRSQGVAGHAPVFGSAQLQNCLQIVVDRLGGGGPMRFRVH